MKPIGRKIQLIKAWAIPSKPIGPRACLHFREKNQSFTQNFLLLASSVLIALDKQTIDLSGRPCCSVCKSSMTCFHRQFKVIENTEDSHKKNNLLIDNTDLVKFIIKTNRSRAESKPDFDPDCFRRDYFSAKSINLLKMLNHASLILSSKINYTLKFKILDYPKRIKLSDL